MTGRTSGGSLGTQ